jgi:hypothetical protein
MMYRWHPALLFSKEIYGMEFGVNPACLFWLCSDALLPWMFAPCQILHYPKVGTSIAKEPAVCEIYSQ